MPAPKIPVQDTALSLEQLAVALARKGIPLPFEIGTFLVLEACERLIGAPALVSARDIYLSDEGEVAIAGSQRAPSDVAAARALLVVLGELLVRSAPGVPPMLLDLCEHGATDDTLGLGILRDQLEAALVPLNRAATRRVLSRLLREVRRERDRSPSVPAPDAERLDAELDALLGAPESGRKHDAAPVAAPPAVAARPAARDEPRHEARQVGWQASEASAEEFEEAQAAFEEAATRRRSAVKVAVTAGVESDRAPRLAASELGETTEQDLDAPVAARRDQALDAFASVDGERERYSARGMRTGFLLIGLAAVVLGAYLVLGQTGARRLVGLAPAPEPPAAAAATPEPPPVRVRYGELRVTSAPSGAQVLLAIGRSPVVAPGLPIGMAHELVAIADGRAPARAVVGADADWQKQEAGSTLTLRIALSELKVGTGTELGPTQLPEKLGTPSGLVGSVRVETEPAGAQVYQLIGFTPEVRVENMKVSEPAELLVYASGYELSRVPLTEQSFVAEGERLVANVNVELRPITAGTQP